MTVHVGVGVGKHVRWGARSNWGMGGTEAHHTPSTPAPRGVVRSHHDGTAARVQPLTFSTE